MIGNICRSPIAEAIFRDKVEKKGLSTKWDIDSAALGSWHVGQRAFKDALKVMQENNIECTHIVRQICTEDFNKFDVIFGKDIENMSELKELQPRNSKAKLELLGEYDPLNERIIEDPYYGSYLDFENVFKQCERCCEAYLNENL